MKLTQVSREEYQEFVENYSGELIKHVEQASEPSVITFHDFTLGDCFQSIVARTFAYSDIPGDRLNIPTESQKYYIWKDKYVDQK